MGCQVSTNQLPQQPTTILPANLPQTQADWSRFIQRMQELLAIAQASGYTTGANVVPAQYSVYDGAALPALRITGATSSLDNSNVQFGLASLKLVATGSQIVLTFGASGYPITIQSVWKWIASLYCRTDQTALYGTLAVVTPSATYSDDISGGVSALTWARLYGTYDLTADSSTSCSITLTLNTTTGATFWVEGWQLEPVQGNTALPSPFILTAPPRTWTQIVDDGKKPANNADVTSQNTAADTSNVAGTPAATVVNTANQANANTPAVINPQFKNGLTGWGVDTLGTGEWYAESGGNSPDASVGTYLVHAGVAGQATTTAHNTGGGITVKPGQVVTAAVALRSVGANAGSKAYVRIGWFNNANTEITNSTQGATYCSPDAGANNFTQGVSRVYGTAPTGATRAIVEIEYDAHTSGYYTATNATIGLQAGNIGEVADGGGRYAVHQVDGNGLAIIDFSQGGHVNKNLDNVADGLAFVRSMQQQGTGAAWDIDNGLFQVNDGGSNTTVPGWVAQPGCSIYSNSTSPSPIYGKQYLVLYTSSGVGNYATSKKSWPVKAGDVISIAAEIYSVNGYSCDANVVFYNSSGGVISAISAASSAAAWVGAKASGAVPSTAAYAQLTLRCAGGSAYACFNAVAVTVNDVRVAGSGAQLGDLRNQIMVGVGNYASGWSGGNITYSATTTSATISVAAASLVIGSQTLAYNASSTTVSGSAGTTVTYYLYYDDPGYAGGSRTLSATTSQLTAMSNDGRVLIGKIAVTYPTSGTGSGGGGSSCPDVHAWVLRADPDGNRPDWCVRAQDVEEGHYLRLSDGRAGLVTYSERKASPRVRVADEYGRSLTCSPSAPLELSAGSFGDCILARSSLGAVVRVLYPVPILATRVATVEDAGDGYVQHITCENACFWTGDDPEHLFSHHNLKPLN